MQQHCFGGEWCTLMKRFFRMLLLICLAAVAAGLTVALWNVSRPGHSHGYSISGVMGRYGMTSADPFGVLIFVSVIFDAAFVIALFFTFPSLGSWLQRKRDGIWPPPKERRPGPPWICPHCHEENPENFNECWKCQCLRAVSGAQ